MAIKTGRVLFFLIMSGALLFLLQFMQWKLYSPPSIDANDPNLPPGEPKPEVLVDKSRKSNRVDDAIRLRSLGVPKNLHLTVAGMKADLGVAPRVMAEPKVKGLPQPALMGHKILELKKRDVSDGQAPRGQAPPRKGTADGSRHSLNEKTPVKVLENRMRVRNPRDPVHRRMDDSDPAVKGKKPRSQLQPRRTIGERAAAQNRGRQTAREQQTNRNNRPRYPLGRTVTEGPRKDVKATRHNRVQRPRAYKKPLVIVPAPTVIAETDRKRSRT
ncbi:uncharacterized protein LOC135207519 [Macrobrachium nipponense]|uniref:uncharacterized protein LOC135207519 n=1 Tax=Macrobrachium nipponense TaxID=159736 RepID=UPI0030C8AF8F